jgi:hypothetical protein
MLLRWELLHDTFSIKSGTFTDENPELLILIYTFLPTFTFRPAMDPAARQKT